METTAHPHSRHLLRIAAILGALAAIITCVTWYLVTPSGGTAITVPLYENGSYHWYRITSGKATLSAAPVGEEAGKGHFPSQSMTLISEKGLEWRTATGTTKYTLIERKGLTPESSFVATDGTVAVLYNDVTNALDVFTVAYQGASVSYVASIPAPGKPSYLIAGGAEGSTIVLHEGAPDTLVIYAVGTHEVTKVGAASIAPQTK